MVHRFIRFALVVAALASGAGLTAGIAGYSKRDALGAVVDGCALNKTIFGNAFPCVSVEQKPSSIAYALLKPPSNPTELLLVPTTAIAGIETPALREPTGALYWQAAWEARGAVMAALGRPLDRTAIGLAVNSGKARSQDRFHIHVDCLGKPEQEAIAAHRSDITTQWSRFPVALEDRRFWMRRVAGNDLSAINPVALMLEGLPAAHRDPAAMSLAVLGATFEDGSEGFYLVAERALPSMPGSGAAEDLLDHSCSGY
jgi:CDP-diacylglycerol pyrophosphatase